MEKATKTTAFIAGYFSHNTVQVRPSALRAALQASAHALILLPAYFLLLAADAALLTILPDLFFASLAFVMPPAVFSFDPRKTTILAYLPLAILLTLFFMAFFITAFFMAAFIETFFIGPAFF